MARARDRRPSPPRDTPRDLAPNHGGSSSSSSAVDCAAVGCCATCDSEIWNGVNRWQRAAAQGYFSAAEASYQISSLKPRGGEARARCEQALQLARQGGAKLEECRISTSLGAALMMTGNADEAIATLERSQHLAEELGESEEMMRAYINLAEVLDQ